jgi:hypothetical protein
MTDLSLNYIGTHCFYLKVRIYSYNSLLCSILTINANAKNRVLIAFFFAGSDFRYFAGALLLGRGDHRNGSKVHILVHIKD